jgi:hypothetical protein
MPDERKDSIREGIGTPAESPTGREAAEERNRRAASSPPLGGAMGGTSDADSPADEAHDNAEIHHEGEPDDDPGRMYRERPGRDAGG